MRVLGLISGGKDSIYNLMECQKQGHDIVALANLRPEELGNITDENYLLIFNSMT